MIFGKITKNIDDIKDFFIDNKWLAFLIFVIVAIVGMVSYYFSQTNQTQSLSLSIWGWFQAIDTSMSVGLLTIGFFAMLFFVYEQLITKFKTKRNLDALREKTDKVALLIDFGKKSEDRISAMSAHAEKIGIPSRNQFKIFANVERVEAENINEFKKLVIEKKSEINKTNASVVYIYYAGPVAGAFHIGDIVSNWKQCVYMHLGKNGYEEWGYTEKTESCIINHFENAKKVIERYNTETIFGDKK